MNITRKGALSLGFLTSLSFSSCRHKDWPWNQEPTSTKGLWGYIDTSGSWVIPPRFDEAFAFSSDDVASVCYNISVTNNSRPFYGLIDTSGTLTMQPTNGSQFYSFPFFPTIRKDFVERGYTNKLPDFDTNKRHEGIADRSGAWVTKTMLEGVTWGCGIDSQGHYVASDSEVFGCKGVVDTPGNWIIDPKYKFMGYDALFYFDKTGCIPVVEKDQDLWGWIDGSGHWIIKPTFSAVKNFYLTDYAAAQKEKDGPWGLIDKSGAWVLDPIYKNLDSPIQDDLCIACDSKTDKYGFINLSGEWVIEPIYSSIGSNDLNEAPIIVVRDPKSDLLGLMDLRDKHMITSFEYARVYLTRSEPYPALDNTSHLWGYIDRTGAWVVPPRYKEFRSFSPNGLAAVKSEE